jgi:hypothetical protein
VLALYLDEDSMDQTLVRALRARGVDVSTALEAGMIERGDADHLAYATAQGRALCTFNVGDFYRLHSDYLARGQSHGGIVLMVQQRDSVGEQMRRLLRLVSSETAETMGDRVEFLSAWEPYH